MAEDNDKKEDEKPETSGESKPEPEETAKEDEKEDEASEKAVEEEKKADETKKEMESDKEEPKKSKEKSQSPTKSESKPIKVSGKLADIIKDIESLSVLELADLVKALEEKFGVSAAAPVAVAGAAPAAGGEDDGGEEKTSFNVILTDSGSSKISVIKAVRVLLPTLGLKEAKDLVDAAPKPVLEGVGKDAANEAKEKLEEAGGKVDLQ